MDQSRHRSVSPSNWLLWDAIGSAGNLILAVLDIQKFGDPCCQSTNTELQTDRVGVRSEMIRRALFPASGVSSEHKGSVVPSGLLGVNGMFMLTRERWRRREERSRTAGWGGGVLGEGCRVSSDLT